MRLIPGLPKPTDGPVYHVALVAKFVAGLPTTVRNFIESVRHITDDPATCADINDLILVAQRSLAALPPDQLAANSTTPAIATVGHCDTPCLTPSCAQPTTHSTANCHWWLSKRKLQDNMDTIQKNIDSGTYKRRRNARPPNSNGKHSHTAFRIIQEITGALPMEIEISQVNSVMLLILDTVVVLQLLDARAAHATMKCRPSVTR
jgi:hypothetical protein